MIQSFCCFIGQQEILIFIHGYNKSFSRVQQIAAQLRYELAFPGPVIAFAESTKARVEAGRLQTRVLTFAELSSK